jgi:hypothetical protein
VRGLFENEIESVFGFRIVDGVKGSHGGRITGASTDGRSRISFWRTAKIHGILRLLRTATGRCQQKWAGQTAQPG